MYRKTNALFLFKNMFKQYNKKNASLLLQGIVQLFEIFLKAQGLNFLSLHFGRQQTMYPQNLTLLKGKGHTLWRNTKT